MAENEHNAPTAEAEAPLRGEELAERAIDAPKDHEQIEEMLKNLDPEEARMFAEALGLVLKKRRWMLIGYLCTLLAIVAGTVIALWVYAGHEPGTFVGWVFLLPPALAATILWAFGAHVRRIR